MIKQLLKFSIFVGLLFSNSRLFSQLDNIGYPLLSHYKRSDYQAGLQSWMISQSSKGLMYFANNSGLLEFDGQNWTTHTFEGQSVIRSLFIDSTDRIYIGCGNDFGFFERDSSGTMHYHSLYALSGIQKEEFEEIWKIHSMDGSIIFQSYKHLIIYNGEEIRVIDAPHLFHFSYMVDKTLYITDNTAGIYVWKSGALEPLPGAEFFNDKEITAVLPFDDQLLITTLDHGVFLYNGKNVLEWNRDLTPFFITNQVYTAIHTYDEHIAFGTVQNGVVLFTKKGVPVLHMNESTGLQNNTILCLYTDLNSNLWLGTDNGIDLLKINSPFRLLNKYNGIGAGYAAIVHNNILYLGTNRGLFYKELNQLTPFTIRNNLFTLIKETKGQVWSLEVIGDELFCGHNNGVYRIEGTVSKKIANYPGVWKFIRSKKNPDRMVAGTYNGLIVFEKKNGEWKFLKRLQGFDKSSRIFHADENENLWISHVLKGVYHITLCEGYDSIEHVEFFGQEKGFRRNYGINVTRIKDRIVFLTPDGSYIYNPDKDSVIPSQEFNTLFMGKKVNFAYETKEGDIWGGANRQIFVMRMLENGKYSMIQTPFNALQGTFIDNFEFVNSISTHTSLMGYENGFIVYNDQYRKKYQQEFRVYFQLIRLSDKTTPLFSGKIFEQNNEPIPIQYKSKGIHFFFSAVDFEHPEKLTYSTFLEGYDQDWSAWERLDHREITNIPEGKYVMNIRARNVFGGTTSPLKFQFIVTPPFYRTTWACIAYVLVLILMAIMITVSVLQRIKKVKQQEQMLQQEKFRKREQVLKQEALVAEKKIIELEKEKLQSKVTHRNKELANQTLGIVQKNKFLKKVEEDLNSIQDFVVNAKAKERISGLKRRIKKEIDIKQQNELFEMYFDEVHDDFFKKLKEKFPDLTASDLRICAFIRMNLTTQEIASILNISYKGAEIRRCRLRKKMALPRDVHLSSYLVGF
ncbi:MAG: triple tyrosine motif-containing protein [Bacteroidales bacterium]|nr:triple tyrosine motif-containing protein [Bacteroidales bacterium]MDD3960636.1 triple tyrosine motif-containing protein [Bacteroidales bacterium]